MLSLRTACVVLVLLAADLWPAASGPKGGPGMLDALLKNASKAVKRGGGTEREAAASTAARPSIAAGATGAPTGASAATAPSLHDPPPAAVPAAAAAGAPERTGESARAGMLTTEEIEACVTRAQALDGDGARIDARSDRLQRLGQSIARDKDALARERERLRRDDAAVVTRHNERAEQVDEAVRDYEAEREALAAEEAVLAAAVERFNAACTSRPYDAAAMQAAIARLGPQGSGLPQ